MDPKTYQTEAHSISSMRGAPFKPHMALCGIGLAGEAAELAECFEAFFFKAGSYDKILVIKEAGDLCWYIAETATTGGLFDFADLIPPGLVDGLNTATGGRGVIQRTMFKLHVTCGKTADMLKKVAFHGKPFEPEKLRSLLQTVMSLLLELLNDVGVSLEHVLAENMTKLRQRYPTGFSPEAAAKRADTDVLYKP